MRRNDKIKIPNDIRESVGLVSLVELVKNEKSKCQMIGHETQDTDTYQEHGYVSRTRAPMSNFKVQNPNGIVE